MSKQMKQFSPEVRERAFAMDPVKDGVYRKRTGWSGKQCGWRRLLSRAALLVAGMSLFVFWMLLDGNFVARYLTATPLARGCMHLYLANFSYVLRRYPEGPRRYVLQPNGTYVSSEVSDRGVMFGWISLYHSTYDPSDSQKWSAYVELYSPQEELLLEDCEPLWEGQAPHVEVAWNDDGTTLSVSYYEDFLNPGTYELARRVYFGEAIYVFDAARKSVRKKRSLSRGEQPSAR